MGDSLPRQTDHKQINYNTAGKPTEEYRVQKDTWLKDLLKKIITVVFREKLDLEPRPGSLLHMTLEEVVRLWQSCHSIYNRYNILHLKIQYMWLHAETICILGQIRAFYSRLLEVLLLYVGLHCLGSVLTPNTNPELK